MEYAISLNSLLPLRSEPSEKSEMVSQLLFGEFCEIKDHCQDFVQIENYADQYTGWADRKMLTTIDKDTYRALEQAPIFRINTPIADVFCSTDKSIYRLTAGSSLPFYDPERSSLEVGGKTFQIHPTFVTHLPHPSKENILSAAHLFLNTPYLWGGKSSMGIDCSGFTQVVFSLNGINIPRDASQQIDVGNPVQSIEDAIPTDLLFFHKNGKIIHVGIYLGENKIIHASGKVRIDTVNKEGVFNEEQQVYSHHLATIRRI